MCFQSISHFSLSTLTTICRMEWSFTTSFGSVSPLFWSNSSLNQLYAQALSIQSWWEIKTYAKVEQWIYNVGRGDCWSPSFNTEKASDHYYPCFLLKNFMFEASLFDHQPWETFYFDGGLILPLITLCSLLELCYSLFRMFCSLRSFHLYCASIWGNQGPK